jgi:hypothetical protein
MKYAKLIVVFCILFYLQSCACSDQKRIEIPGTLFGYLSDRYYVAKGNEAIQEILVPQGPLAVAKTESYRSLYSKKNNDEKERCQKTIDLLNDKRSKLHLSLWHEDNQEILVPRGTQGVSETEPCHSLYSKKQKERLQKTIGLLNDRRLKLSPSVFDNGHYSVSPTGGYILGNGLRNMDVRYSVSPTEEYLLRLGKGVNDIKKKIYDVRTSESFEVNTSDRGFNFSLVRYAWSPDGRRLAISREDKNKGDKACSSALIVNLSNREVERDIKLEERIEGVTWDFLSCRVAILSKESHWARTLINIIIPWAWFHPQEVQSFYLHIVDNDIGAIAKKKIAHRIDGMFWVK